MAKKNSPRSQKIMSVCLPVSISQEAYIVWLWFLVHICKMMTFPKKFFVFSKFWFFRLLGRQEGKKKMVQNDKKLCLFHSITQEPYLIWLWFLVDRCKMMIYPGVFLYFFFKTLQILKFLHFYWPTSTVFSNE